MKSKWCPRMRLCPNCGGARAVDSSAQSKIAAAAWILAGGAHHTGFSQAVTAAHLQDFADMADLECLLINKNTDLAEFKKRFAGTTCIILWRKGCEAQRARSPA